MNSVSNTKRVLPNWMLDKPSKYYLFTLIILLIIYLLETSFQDQLTTKRSVEDLMDRLNQQKASTHYCEMKFICEFCGLEIVMKSDCHIGHKFITKESKTKSKQFQQTTRYCQQTISDFNCKKLECRRDRQNNQTWSTEDGTWEAEE